MSLLDALHCQNRGRPPVWLMRQAGRYMPEYQAIRKRHSFVEMCHNPKLAIQVTKLPIELLGVDAAILFSDILTLSEGLGIPYRIEEGIGPVLENRLESAADLKRLKPIKDQLSYVAEAIQLWDLDVPLIGFAGGPFTLTHYMAVNHKQWMFRDPTSFHQLLSLITEGTIAYTRMQEKAGAKAIQIFDSWANALAPDQFETFALPYLKRIVDSLAVPVILFSRGASIYAEKLASLRPAAISLDWNADMAQVRRQLGPNIALQGNLDPDILSAPHDVIRSETIKLLEVMDGDPGYIFNLGHGVLPHHTVEAVKVMVDTVQGWAGKEQETHLASL